jgi:hypothetical protein
MPPAQSSGTSKTGSPSCTCQPAGTPPDAIGGSEFRPWTSGMSTVVWAVSVVRMRTSGASTCSESISGTTSHSRTLYVRAIAVVIVMRSARTDRIV